MKIATVCSIDNMLEYEKIGANAFIFGLLNYSSGYHNEISIEEIKKIRETYKGELFIAVNKNMFNGELKGLEEALIELDKLDINEIRNKTKMKLFLNVLGYQVMGYSRRHLLSNYFKSLGKDLDKDNYVIKNNGEDYIVREEKYGNVFLNGKILNGSIIIKDLDVDYIILNDYNFDKDIFSKVLDLYTKLVATKDEKYVSLIDELVGEDRGFFFKKTIYKVKKND